jgi:hypothetical protein
MRIETKFNIGDLVRHKYSKATAKTVHDGLLLALTVLDIKTETCIAGTQIFYICRALYQHRKSKFSIKEDDELVEIGYSGVSEATKLREDELQICPEEIIKIITGEA